MPSPQKGAGEERDEDELLPAELIDEGGATEELELLEETGATEKLELLTDNALDVLETGAVPLGTSFTASATKFAVSRAVMYTRTVEPSVMIMGAVVIFANIDPSQRRVSAKVAGSRRWLTAMEGKFLPGCPTMTPAAFVTGRVGSQVA